MKKILWDLVKHRLSLAETGEAGMKEVLKGAPFVDALFITPHVAEKIRDFYSNKRKGRVNTLAEFCLLLSIRKLTSCDVSITFIPYPICILNHFIY